MSTDILGTSWDQSVSTVQYCFTSTETIRLVRTESPGQPPRLSHTSWALIFRHWPIIVYTRLPAGGTYYPICMFPTISKCLIGTSDAFSAFGIFMPFLPSAFPMPFLPFVSGYPSSSPRAHRVYPQQKRAYSALHIDDIQNTESWLSMNHIEICLTTA